jgi:hypothetical protein
MLDYVYFNSRTNSSCRVIPGVYPGKDHDAMYTEFNINR